VPPFSTRVMAHKALLELPLGGAPTIDPRSVGDPVFKLPKGFPAEVRDAYAVIGSRLVTYRRNGDRLEPTGQAQPAKEYLKPQNADFLAENDGGWGEELKPEARIAQLARPLMVYSLRLMKDDELKAFSLPEGRVRLFVYSPLPPQLHTLSAGAESEETPQPLTGQSGSVLYSFDLAL
jgi:hypothetical protein